MRRDQGTGPAKGRRVRRETDPLHPLRPQRGGVLSPQEVLSAAHGQGDATGAILLGGLVRVAAYIQEKALLGELSATVAQAAIKELGLTEGPAEEAMEPLQVILDAEAEAYSR